MNVKHRSVSLLQSKKKQYGALTSTTATTTTTPYIKILIGRVGKNKRAARTARTYEQVRAVLCKTTT